MNIQDATTEQLLAEIIRRNGYTGAPMIQRHVEPVQCCLVGIGKDHTADILIHTDDLKALSTIGARPVEFVER